MAVLRLILGDQLTHDLPIVANASADDIFLMCEVQEEATYVKHHKQKIALLFSAMRHFAAELEGAGHTVRYVKLDDADNTHSFDDEVKRALTATGADKILVTEAGEHRVQEKFKVWQTELDIDVEILPDVRFFCDHKTFADWAKDRKELRMEFFYREQRRAHNVLMNGKDPEGGQWNFDHDNRNAYDGKTAIPERLVSAPDDVTCAVIELVNNKFSDHFGDLNKDDWRYGVTASEAEQHLNDFITTALPQFGIYQDAMVMGEPFLFHGLISMYLNCGLLTPRQVVDAVEAAYHNDDLPLNAVEGFIRQVLGWREYVRGIYWLKMPDYAEENFLNAKTPLPKWFWDANTKMECLHQSIKQTQQCAYAHHIQRLMIIGNFALLAGLDVEEVCTWYLLVYADAYEWVELPNTLGMALFGDGGILASKPYAASGNYVNKMSDYCRGCHYNVKQKEGKEACPFNYLYWDFLARNADKLGKNPRLKFPYATLRKMDADKIETYKNQTKVLIKNLDNA